MTRTVQTPFLVSLLVAMAALASACAGTTAAEGPDALAFPASDVELDTELASDALATDAELIDVELAEFHARWLCELQRRQFPDLAALDDALREALAGAGYARDDYEDFVNALQHSEPSLLAFRELYTERCTG